MATQGNVLKKEQFIGAPIERAHLDRGFKAKKTPLKWIKFFRACVLQREVAEEKKKKKKKILWVSLVVIIIICFIVPLLIPVFFIALITASIINYFINKEFNKKYIKGFDFFADYFSAFFSLIEEDLALQSRITFDANLKNTISPEFHITNKVDLKEEKSILGGLFSVSSKVLSRSNDFYEREICTGSFVLSDHSGISFQFTEKIRRRNIKKRSASGKIKYKSKYKSVYPFILRMKIPKNKYQLNPSINQEDINLTDDGENFILKVRRKFDPKAEDPRAYNPYEKSGITNYAVDYFALELINLINTCYSCVTPKS